MKKTTKTLMCMGDKQDGCADKTVCGCCGTGRSSAE